jgi:glycosyltransferase involved in cell wall biosynthesis
LTKVSVIVPTYNYARFLPDALESLRSQTYGDWECIVVDDGSTDATRAVVATAMANDGRVRYVHQPNRGASAARNRGIAESVGDYIQFLDADDVLPCTKLEAQIRLMETDPSIGIVYSDTRYFQDSATKLLSYLVPGPRPSSTPDERSSDPLLRALIRHNIMAVEGPLIRRSALMTVGPFEVDLVRMEDWQYWLRCALAGIRFVADSDAETAVRVRVHGDSTTRNLLAMHASELGVRRWLEAHLDDQDLRHLNEVRTSETLARIGVMEGRAGSLRVGIGHLLRAGIAERRVDWLVAACVLPLMRIPGCDQVLALRRRLLRKPRIW